MASCGLGTSNTKVLNLDFGGTMKVGLLQRFAVKSWGGRRPQQYAGLIISRRPEKLLTACCGSSLGTTQLDMRSKDESKDMMSSRLTSKLKHNFNEVESLLTIICDTSSIAEFELKLGGLQLHVTRKLTEKIMPLGHPTIPATVSVNVSAEASDFNGSVSVSSLTISKPVYSSSERQSLLGKAADEGLVIIKSPSVGFFRRSRTVKGKRAPPSCKEKQIVKEGQVLCYIEQLGGELPVESDSSGEVIKILKEDGDPVGYNDAVVAILPSFPGIKKLQQTI